MTIEFAGGMSQQFDSYAYLAMAKMALEVRGACIHDPDTLLPGNLVQDEKNSNDYSVAFYELDPVGQRKFVARAFGTKSDCTRLCDTLVASA